MGVTIKDVAKLAGVSHTTVSMVIHNDHRITRATKKKVLDAIKKLNYYPNYFARGLVQGKTNTIAVIAAFFSSPFELDILKGIELRMDECDSHYNLNQYATRGKNEIKTELFYSILYGKRADAVIALNLKPDITLMKNFETENIPIILIEEKMKGLSYVKTNNIKGAYLATEYLIKKGKKNIGLINGVTKGKEVGLSPKERLSGYKKALKAYNLPFKHDNVIDIVYYYYEEGKDVLKTYRKRKNKIDSIFCAAGDMVAIGILEEARGMGVSIPEDISIIGYDDMLMASLIFPSLTTVKQPVQEMGAKAFDFVMEKISDKSLKDLKLVLQPELVIRESA